MTFIYRNVKSDFILYKKGINIMIKYCNKHGLHSVNIVSLTESDIWNDFKI